MRRRRRKICNQPRSRGFASQARHLCRVSEFAKRHLSCYALSITSPVYGAFRLLASACKRGGLKPSKNSVNGAAKFRDLGSVWVACAREPGVHAGPERERGVNAPREPRCHHKHEHWYGICSLRPSASFDCQFCDRGAPVYRKVVQRLIEGVAMLERRSCLPVGGCSAWGAESESAVYQAGLSGLRCGGATAQVVKCQR